MAAVDHWLIKVGDHILVYKGKLLPSGLAAKNLLDCLLIIGLLFVPAEVLGGRLHGLMQQCLKISFLLKVSGTGRLQYVNEAVLSSHYLLVFIELYNRVKQRP